MSFRFSLILCLCSFLVLGCGKDRETIKTVEQLTSEKKFDQALNVLQKGIRENPKNKKLLRLQVLVFLRAENVEYTVAAYRKLSEVSPEDPLLVDTLKSGTDPALRATAAKALGFLKDPVAIEALIVTASDKDKSIRQATVLALGEIRDPRAVAVLVKTLQDEDWFVRAEAAMALGKVGDSKAAAELFKLINDPDPYVRGNAMKALQALATESNKSAFIDALKSPDDSVRSMAAIALARMGNSDGVDVLIEQLANPAGKNRTDCIRGLTKLKDPKALPTLRKTAAADPRLEVRVVSIMALGEFKDKDSIPLLKTLLKDEGGDVRIYSAQSLAKDHCDSGHALSWQRASFQEAKLLCRAPLIRRGQATQHLA